MSPPPAGARFTTEAEPEHPAVTCSSLVLDSLRRDGLVPSGDWALDDTNVAAAIARVYRMGLGQTALECATAQAAQASGVALPLTQDPVELHVVEVGSDGGRSSRHAARWIADPDRPAPEGFAVVGMESTTVTPGVLDAVRSADLVVLPPMSPVLDAAGFLAAEGLRDALRGTAARVVVMSPVGLHDGRPAGAEEAAWQLTGQPAASTSLARLYSDFADVLLIDDSEPAGRYPASLRVARVPLAGALAGDSAAVHALWKTLTT